MLVPLVIRINLGRSSLLANISDQREAPPCRTLAIENAAKRRAVGGRERHIDWIDQVYAFKHLPAVFSICVSRSGPLSRPSREDELPVEQNGDIRQIVSHDAAQKMILLGNDKRLIRT